MPRIKVRSACSHRLLIVLDIDRKRSVEISRCYECGTRLIRFLDMSLSAWFPFPRKKLPLIPRPAQASRRTLTTVPPAP
jgi:hypothetical protein